MTNRQEKRNAKREEKRLARLTNTSREVTLDEGAGSTNSVIWSMAKGNRFTADEIIYIYQYLGGINIAMKVFNRLKAELESRYDFATLKYNVECILSDKKEPKNEDEWVAAISAEYKANVHAFLEGVKSGNIQLGIS